MRKFLTIIFTLIAVCANAQTSIWSGSKAIGWGSGVSLTADKFASAEVGDIMRITFTVTGNPSNWPQIRLRTPSGSGSVSGSSDAQLSNGTTNYDITSYDFYFNKTMLDDLQANGMLFDGYGATITDVSLIKGAGAANYKNAVWIGSTDATSGWVAQSVPGSSFADAAVGKYLRLYYEDLKAGAMHTIVDSSWKEISGYGFYNMSGLYYQYTIDQTLLSNLKNGIIINGTGYRLTHVDILDPTSASAFTCSSKNNGWLYEGKKPEIVISVKNNQETAAEAEVKLNVKTDKMEAYTSVSQTVNVAAGASQDVTLTFEADPGFYCITPSVNGEQVYTADKFSDGNKSASFIIGIDPTKVVSAADMQDDFDTFWSDTKAELAKVDPEYKLTELTAKSSTTRKVYLLEFKSLNDMGDTAAIARAYYAEPVAKGKYPAIIHYQGYDSGNYAPWCMNGSDNPGYIELILATRGQLINNRSPYTNNYGDWFAYGFGKKETYYYRGAFMDAVRAIEFIRSREQSDTENIFAEGSSQGGALTYAAAALTDHPFRAIAPSIPFLGDYPDYFQVASWPASVAFAQQKALGMNDADMYKFLSYFDTKNLATKIHCPVIETLGLQDNTCPPHTNMAPYNNLPSDVEKEVSYNALLMHIVPNSWTTTYRQFFKDHMATAGIEEVSCSESVGNNSAAYNLNGQRVSPTAKGIVIIGGKKQLNH